MTYKTYTTYRKVKIFIKNFYFPNPSWEDLPVGFPNLPKVGLTHEEGLLLDAIKLAYVNEVGRKTLIRHISLICLISLIGLLSLIFLSGQDKFTKPVSAATVKVDEVIQSTMSAILRK